jgi:hypothetical protein
VSRFSGSTMMAFMGSLVLDDVAGLASLAGWIREC